jgi:hypothetical protein
MSTQEYPPAIPDASAAEKRAASSPVGLQMEGCRSSAPRQQLRRSPPHFAPVRTALQFQALELDLQGGVGSPTIIPPYGPALRPQPVPGV